MLSKILTDITCQKDFFLIMLLLENLAFKEETNTLKILQTENDDKNLNATLQDLMIANFYYLQDHL